MYFQSARNSVCKEHSKHSRRYFGGNTTPSIDYNTLTKFKKVYIYVFKIGRTDFTLGNMYNHYKVIEI